MILTDNTVALFFIKKLKRDWIAIIREMAKYIIVYLYHRWIKKNELYLLIKKPRAY